MNVIKVTRDYDPGCSCCGLTSIVGLFHDIRTAVAAADKDAEIRLLIDGDLGNRPKDDIEYTWRFSSVEVGSFPIRETWMDYNLTIGAAWDKLAAAQAARKLAELRSAPPTTFGRGVELPCK